MLIRRFPAAALIAGVVLIPSLAQAKEKAKATLPVDVLQAHTVSVVIDPRAGVALDDPRANEVAQRDVETAFANWGRYDPVLTTRTADLIIVVRRGSGKIASGTVADPRQGRRTGMIDPTDRGIVVGAQRGSAPSLGAGDASPAQDGPPGEGPHPQAEFGDTEDAFLVYRGNVAAPLDAPPVWRYQAKNALKPHTVPAVGEFRKAVTEADKAAAKQP